LIDATMDNNNMQDGIKPGCNDKFGQGLITGMLLNYKSF